MYMPIMTVDVLSMSFFVFFNVLFKLEALFISNFYYLHIIVSRSLANNIM